MSVNLEICKKNILVRDLIGIIKKKTVIWDSTNLKYKDESAQESAWREVYATIEPNFDTLTKADQLELGNYITEKWFNLRDSYKISRKNPRYKRSARYIEMLTFLDMSANENCCNRDSNETSKIKSTVESSADVGDGCNSKDNRSSDDDESVNEPRTKKFKTENKSQSEITVQNHTAKLFTYLDVCKKKFSTRDLIKVIEEKTVLWDKNCISYYDREKREEAWKEVYKTLEPRFDELKESEQQEIGTYVKTLWRHARYRYVQSCIKTKNKRPYMYSDLLKFLNTNSFKDPRNSFTVELEFNRKHHLKSHKSTNLGEDNEDGLCKSHKNKHICKPPSKSSQSTENSKITISIEELILVIKEKKPIWDRAFSNKKYKVRRARAWKEVCRAMIPNFDAVLKSAQRKIAVLIAKKWSSVRGSYFRYLKNGGSSRPYIYYELLKFLDSQYLEHINLDRTEKKIADSCHNLSEVDKGTGDKTVSAKYQREEYVTGNKQSNSEEKLSAILEKILEREQDEERSFFKSILTSVKSLSEESKSEFKISIMTLIQTLKNKDQENFDNIKQEVTSIRSDESVKSSDEK